jgi:Protein of unknown function (DUF1214)
MFNHSHIEFDATGRALTGERRYTITLEPPIPIGELDTPGFWSMTMYDGTTKLTVEMTFPLKLLFQNPECLIDIIVTNENFQSGFLSRVNKQVG